MTPVEPTPPRRTPVYWLILVAAVAVALYYMVPYYRDYHPDSAICAAVAVTAGVDKVPSGCKTPTVQTAIAVAIVFAGVWIANKVGRKA